MIYLVKDSIERAERLESKLTRAKLLEVGVNVTLWEQDCWEIPLDLLPRGVNVFFHDGPHDYDPHREAVPHFAPVFTDELVLVVDDFEDEKVRQATRGGIDQARMHVLDYYWLGCGEHESRAGWWNSIGIFILRK